MASDTNAKTDIFAKTLAPGAIVRADVSSSGGQSNKGSSQPWLNADGTIVAFGSNASNLIASDTNSREDVFLRDTTAGTTTLVSVATDGTQGDDTSQNPMVSADGRTTAFQSLATNLVAGDTNATTDVFVHGPGLDATSYTYDHLSRLTGSTGPDGAPSYAYDPVGNRTSKVLAGTTTSYSYDRADRITAAGSASISVDANGNTTAKGSDSFSYDQANRLTSATVGPTSETYAYDGDGLRFSRTVGTDPAIRFVSDVNRSLPVTIADGTRKYVYGLGIAYAVSGSAVEVYHADRLGSVRSITDASGAVTATYRYDDWGNLTAQTGSSGQPFGFTGEPADATGLTYLRARYYDPSLGRFTSRDTFGGQLRGPGTLNRYSYALQNPLRLNDPSGRKSGCLTDSTGFSYDPYGVLPNGYPVPFLCVGSADVRTCVAWLAYLDANLDPNGPIYLVGGLAAVVSAPVWLPATVEAIVAAGGTIVTIANSLKDRLNTVSNPIIGLQRVGSALKTDPYHAFPEIVDNAAGAATEFDLASGARLYQLEGSLNGVVGRFEWIVDNGVVTHRLFVPGGTITGIPSH